MVFSYIDTFSSFRKKRLIGLSISDVQHVKISIHDIFRMKSSPDLAIIIYMSLGDVIGNISEPNHIRLSPLVAAL